MPHRRHRAAPLAVAILGLIGLQARAVEPTGQPAPAAAKEAKESKYIRIERDERKNPIGLQTVIVEFTPTKTEQAGLRVDLVGAVHVGERAYYEQLNEAFTKYDVVLYELVAPTGTRVPKGGKTSDHPVGMLQNAMKDFLELEHQLSVVDYTKDNLMHADMSPDQFSKSMKDRNESFWSIFFRMMGQGLAQQAKQQAKGKSTDLDMLMALFDKNRAMAMKRVMAEQFEEMEGMMEALDGPKGSTIVTERNRVAFEVLAKQIAAGKKRIAVFYGAGHLRDMEKRLVTDFGLKRSGERWLTAWNLRRDEKKPVGNSPSPKPPVAPAGAEK